VTGADRAGRAVLWLTAQAVVFGAMAALLGIVANTMFLDTYGSEWLPVTYIAIGIAGVLISGAVARSARSAELVPIALAVLGGATVVLALAWWIASSGDGAWVSVPLLILFPILIQLGFVFIGGQAGRLLDIAGIKASFPRIVAGFPAGAVLGGIVGGWLVGWSGRQRSPVARYRSGRLRRARLGDGSALCGPSRVDRRRTGAGCCRRTGRRTRRTAVHAPVAHPPLRGTHLHVPGPLGPGQPAG
jgi:hypothetical protein